MVFPLSSLTTNPEQRKSYGLGPFNGSVDSTLPCTDTYKILPSSFPEMGMAQARVSGVHPQLLQTVLPSPKAPGLGFPRSIPRQGGSRGFRPSSAAASANDQKVGHSSPWREVTRLSAAFFLPIRPDPAPVLMPPRPHSCPNGSPRRQERKGEKPRGAGSRNPRLRFPSRCQVGDPRYPISQLLLVSCWAVLIPVCDLFNRVLLLLMAAPLFSTLGGNHDTFSLRCQKR